MINEAIKSARKAKGISQEEMAAELNVVRQTVSKWETGLSVPDADVLIRISDLLEVSVNDLLGVRLQDGTAESLADELARANERLAIQNQEKSLRLEAEKKRRTILLLSFMAMLAALGVKDELLSLLLIGGCILAALVILYRNLALLTKETAAVVKTGPLKIATGFNLVIFASAIIILALNRAAVMAASEREGRLAGMAVISSVMLFGGFISPRLPRNRHTGLRLPWTVRDEETWRVAHSIIGYLSFPLVLLYLAAAFTVSGFEAVTAAVIFLWIGVPGLLSLLFWLRKHHGRR